MNQKRFLGFALLLAGMLISLSRIVLTGAVIGARNSSFVGIAGAIIVVIGVILILSSFVKS